MNVLALECSTTRRSVAVAREGRILAEAHHERDRDTPLLAMVDDLLRRADMPRATLSRLVVGLGPGSYTGIRASIALALGWELARPVTLVGISSVEACARRCFRLGHRGWTAVVVDAQRGDFYVAEYDLEDGGPRARKPLALASRDRIEQLGSAGARLVGPEVESCGLRGDPVLPDAATLAELAMERPPDTPSDRLEPIYLRPVNFVKAPPPRVLPELR